MRQEVIHFIAEFIVKDPRQTRRGNMDCLKFLARAGKKGIPYLWCKLVGKWSVFDVHVEVRVFQFDVVF